MVASTLAAVAVAVMAMTGVAVVVAAAAMMGAPGSGSPFLCSTSAKLKEAACRGIFVSPGAKFGGNGEN